jgi:hypothetical protein
MSAVVVFTDIRAGEPVGVVGIDEGEPVVLAGSIEPGILSFQVRSGLSAPITSADGDVWLRSLAQCFRGYLWGEYIPDWAGTADETMVEPPVDEAQQRFNKFHKPKGAKKEGGKPAGGEFADKVGSIQEVLLNGEVANVEPVPGRADLYLLRMATVGGVNAVLKREGGPQEMAVRKVNDWMGDLVRMPIAVMRPLPEIGGDWALPSMMDVTHVQTLSPGKRADKTPDWPTTVNPELLRDAAVFDAVVAIIDRHVGNWMVEEDHTITLIDHTLTFKNQTYNDMVENYRRARREQGRNVPGAVILSNRHRSALLKFKSALRTGGRDELLALGITKREIDWMVQRTNQMLENGIIPLNNSFLRYEHQVIDA